MGRTIEEERIGYDNMLLRLHLIKLIEAIVINLLRLSHITHKQSQYESE
jgi:hypothetical protein